MTPTICKIVTETLAHRWAKPQAAPESQLADMGVDAIDRASIAHMIWETFGIDLPKAEESAWGTVADIIASVERGRPDGAFAGLVMA